MSTPDNSLEARVERLELDLAEAVSAITRLSVEQENLKRQQTPDEQLEAWKQQASDGSWE